MQKKGDVWISAVLYFGLGLVIITILLAAGLPVINKLKDKNIVIQSKEVMHTLDESIREVVKEGSGSQRVVTINIKKGSLVIDEANDIVMWAYNNSKVFISEPGIPVQEGKLTVLSENSPMKKSYNIQISTNYSGIADVINSDKGTILVGINDLVIRNQGLDTTVTPNKIKIGISQANR